ncbi:MAG TPA: hypothetical protein VMW58_10990 [Anaerolineae bacterium]|nr:hypothetical protein [Anaerolineae bacterium]
MHTVRVPARDMDRHRGRRHIQGVAATLPVVISDTEAVYLYGVDIVAGKREGCTNHGTGAVPRCTP